jgi:oligopeptidase B
VAKLRANKTDNNMLLLHTNMEAGHGGASGRFESLKETAMEYAFMFKLAGITE